MPENNNDIFLLVCFIFIAFLNENGKIIYFFIYFISIFILLTHRKAMEALIHRASNYLDLLLEIQDIAVRL